MMRIPKQYLDVYETISKFADIGSLDFIALHGIFAHLNNQLDDFPDNCQAYAEIRSQLAVYTEMRDKVRELSFE